MRFVGTGHAPETLGSSTEHIDPVSRRLTSPPLPSRPCAVRRPAHRAAKTSRIDNAPPSQRYTARGCRVQRQRPQPDRQVGHVQIRPNGRSVSTNPDRPPFIAPRMKLPIANRSRAGGSTPPAPLRPASFPRTPVRPARVTSYVAPCSNRRPIHGRSPRRGPSQLRNSASKRSVR
jgi:hypothetical protein